MPDAFDSAEGQTQFDPEAEQAARDADVLRGLGLAEQEPTVGRIVHYVAQDGKHKAAIIIDVNQPGGGAPQTVDLQVAMHSGWVVVPASPYQAEAEPDTEGTWHWPERA
jgi:hypothetical protein